MKKNILFLWVVFLFTNYLQAQIKPQRNYPILFLEAFGGYSIISDSGFAGGFELNYQKNKNLVSFRIIEIAGYIRTSEPIALISQYTRTKHDNEYALLFGKRWLQNNHSLSVSSGVSYNHFISKDNNADYLGLPLEANIIWYSSKKTNTIGHIVTPKFGFKLFGSISRNSFAGIGISLSIGTHKQ